MKKIALKFALIGCIAMTTSSVWAAKTSVPATIKDLQPTNFSVSKKKHQQYDFSIQTTSTNYQCRTSQDKSLNATDFPVGTEITFTFDGPKGQIKTTNNKSTKCTITRVNNSAK